MKRGTRGGDFLRRHKAVAGTKQVKFVTVAIEDTADPGPFRSSDERTILAGETGNHVIVAAVFAHLKLRWVITAGSRHPKVEYHHGPTDTWGAHTHSDIFGDDFVGQYDTEKFPDLALPPAALPGSLVETFTGEVRFGIRHSTTADACSTLPHEVESKALVGGYHEGVGVAQAFVDDRKEISKTRCR